MFASGSCSKDRSRFWLHETESRASSALGSKIQFKKRIGERPGLQSRAAVIAGASIAEKSVIGVGKSDIDERLVRALQSVRDRSGLRRLDVLVFPAPE